MQSVNIGSERDVTIHDLMSEADKIWKKRGRYTSALNEEEAQALIKKFQAEHKEFTTAYPVVVRCMVDGNMYSPMVFHDHLQHLIARPMRSEEEYIEAQANYVANTIRRCNMRATEFEISQVRSSVVDSLKAEMAKFKNLYEKTKATVEEAERDADRARRKYVLDQIKTGPIFVEDDVPAAQNDNGRP